MPKGEISRMKLLARVTLVVLPVVAFSVGCAPDQSAHNARIAELYVIGVNDGDEQVLLDCLADNLSVYNNSFPPRHGAATHAAYWLRMHEAWRARFTIDRLVASDSDAVMEWSALLHPAGSSTEQLVRGVDWLLFEGGKIVEIHEYGDPRLAPEPPPISGALVGFPYEDRGYPTADTLDSMLPE
jgi:ketosteroid isomerase-like protein